MQSEINIFINIKNILLFILGFLYKYVIMVSIIYAYHYVSVSVIISFNDKIYKYLISTHLFTVFL